LDERGEAKDALLDQLEETVKKCIYRKLDIVLQREKEKILSVICEVDLQGAQVIRQRIEGEIQKHFIKDRDNPPVIKLGVATYPEEAISKRNLFRRAKEKLRS